MAFNSNTYQANKSAKSAYAQISQAKDIKRRAAIGEAYDWEIRRIASLAQYARWDMHRSLFFRSLNK